MKTALLVLLAVLLVWCILLAKVGKTLSLKDLRARARGKHGADSRIYKLAAHGDSTRVLLWLAGSFSGAALFVMLAGISVWTASFLLVFVSWLVLSTAPPKYSGALWKLAGILCLPTNKIVEFLQPVLIRLARLSPIQTASPIYDQEDLLELLGAQQKNSSSQISADDLKTIQSVISFGNKTVRQLMTPLGKVKFAAADDSIGPLLMDELHKSGFGYFPVVGRSRKKSSPNIVGTLHLADVLGYNGKGKVRDVMQKRVDFIKESATLRQALDVCLKSHQQLLIVANNFEEIAGIITLKDILEQILGADAKEELQSKPKVLK